MKSWSKNRIDLLIANQQISQMYSTVQYIFALKFGFFSSRQGLENIGFFYNYMCLLIAINYLFIA